MLPGIYEQQRGPEVGIDDQMWDGVQDGAFIAVRACARRNYWENEGQYAEILVWKWFEPVVSVA
ncbi:hypothetical protein K438DRAFT_1851970 [Mycena galopus ATCC 62051]|nr:hypothetical protein K438DRAFT_1851970 [Mycena galopus ATCC 62051]